jgi:hypothetical protein
MQIMKAYGSSLYKVSFVKYELGGWIKHGQFVSQFRLAVHTNSLCIRKGEMLFNDLMSENNKYFPEVIFGLNKEHVIVSI